MTTSKELNERLVRIKKDAAVSVCEILGERESINIRVDIDDETYARRLYHKDDMVFVEVREPEPYEYYAGADENGMVTGQLNIERLGMFQLISLLKGLENA